MSAILEKYGTYIIEPGTLLFRQAPNRQFYDSMFFGFCENGASTSNHWSDNIQIWKATREIKSLLMLKGQHKTGEEPILYSAIVDIYNEHFPADRRHEYDDLLLKKQDTVYRRRIIRLLKNEGICSWVCSVEDNYPMELFLFAGVEENSEMVSYVESFKTFPGPHRKVYPNSFDYSKVSHLQEMRKGPAPPDPFTNWMMLGP